ncbi:MAG: S-layer homology domain-containing protein [Clostridiales bacterium]|nr:S-layer homology domain-containing protein [Clostridiales bacterium]
MKRIIATLVCTSLLIVNSVVSYSAENDVQIQGVDEWLDRICLNSDANAGIRAQMEETYEEYLKSKINDIMEYPDYVKEKMGLKLGNEEYIEKQIREGYGLNLDKGLLISSLNNTKYLNQYSKAGCFSYLLNENNVFKVNRNNEWYGAAIFSEDGKILTENEICELKMNTYIQITDDNMFDYLNDRIQLKNELAKNGETAVQNVKLFGLSDLTLLYIKCESTEYLIKMYDDGNRVLPTVSQYVLYKANELISAFDNPDINNSPYSQVLSELILKTKSTYETEAKSLQEDGLIQGNENGLDLLKPLTRIEATAILVRAMGFEEAQTASTSYFADIPSDNWGAKYANIAYDKGIAMGVGDDLFAPNDTITASQFATLILRSKGEDPDWQTAVDIFVERGLISSEQAQTMDLFTRGDMAKMIYEARQNNIL